MNIQQFWSDVFAQRADEIRNTSTPMPAKRGNSSILDGLTRRGKQEDTSRKALKTLGKRQKYCLSTVSRPPAALPSSASAKITKSPEISTVSGFFPFTRFDAICPFLSRFIRVKNGLIRKNGLI